MNSAKPAKTQWTWEEWQAGRQARRALSLRVGKPVCRRQESSSDRRLRAAFNGERAPGLGGAKGEAGFTRGELIAVLALLALLAAAVFPLLQNAVLNTEMDGCGVGVDSRRITPVTSSRGPVRSGVLCRRALTAVGSSYNLCHEFLSGNGEKSMDSLRSFGPEASLVSINGVDPADKKRFILPLGEGAFAMAAFLAELKRLGYKGPVGHQFYNIPGDIEPNLKSAITAWRSLQPK